MADDQLQDEMDAGQSLGEHLLKQTGSEPEEVSDPGPLEQWMQEYPETQAAFEKFMDPAQRKPLLQSSRRFEEKIPESMERLSSELDAPNREAHRAVRKLIYYLSGAAAAALVAVATFVLVKHSTKIKQGQESRQAIAIAHDIKPGGNKATLTLGNGTQILLDSAHTGLLARQGGYRIVKQANGALVYSLDNRKEVAVFYNTVTTPRGGQYRLGLPDGTKVWLNAASSITYPTAFTGARRDVTITGEAYFEVAANKSVPFTVKASNAEIKVLGTHFDVMAYEDEKELETTLLEGAVAVSQGQATKILRPDQQARIDTKGILTVADVDADDYVAWKNGLIELHHADIPTLMRQISRWYDVQVVYQGNHFPSWKVAGTIPRTLTLSQVLEVLSLNGINCKLEGRMITVNL